MQNSRASRSYCNRARDDVLADKVMCDVIIVS